MSAADRPCATRLSIWCRTAMAVVAFDWATETSVHDGQRTPASMAAARWAAVWRAVSKSPLPTTSATARTTSGSATRAHSGTAGALSHGTGGLVRLGGGQERVEVLLRGRAHQRRRDAAGRVDDEGRGRCRHPVALSDRPARVAHGGPEVAVRPQERARRRRRVVEHHADHVGSVDRMGLLVVEAREVGCLLLARDAPAGEEVDHDVVAAERGQRDARPVLRSVPLNGGRGAAEQRALRPRWPPGASAWPAPRRPRRGPPGPHPPPNGSACAGGGGSCSGPAPRATRAPTGSGAAASRSRVLHRRRRQSPASRRPRPGRWPGAVSPGPGPASPPTPMSRPPAHSQATSGSITTPMATEPAGRLLMAWLPDVEPSPPTASKVR